jgi:hypothetical protein
MIVTAAPTRSIPLVKCNDFTPRPFLWQNGHLYGFNIVAPAGTQLLVSEPASINDRGEIVGYVLLDTGFQAFLLIPCDPEEPCDDVTTTVSPAPDAAHTSFNSAAQPNLTPAEKVALLSAQFNRHHHISALRPRDRLTLC